MENKEITVHVMCHTHDDPGWIWTFNDYYLGTDKCMVSVKKILDNIIPSFEHDSKRKFSYVEMSFFKPWYMSQPEDIKNKIKTYIKEGRLEIINGGWVMHDEASVHFNHLFDNMRLGLEFLKNEFNITPSIGWYIDPFGHSSTNAYLLSQMKFDHLVLTRIHYQDKSQRKNTQTMEFIYNPYNDNNNKIFTHISYDHYCPPKSIRNYINDKLIPLKDEELVKKCEEFYEDMKLQAQAYGHNHVLLYYGDDFTFTEADINYKNIEQIMNYFNDENTGKGRMKLIYSTPSDYFKAIESLGYEFKEQKDFDFFPYADNAHCYWTGYFSSRANLKGLVKQLGIYIQNVSALFCEMKLQKNTMNPLLNEFVKDIYIARETLGLLQHHDAITGTSKEKVNKDYEHLAIESIYKMKGIIDKMVSCLYKTQVIRSNIVSSYEEKVTLYDNVSYLIGNILGYDGNYLFNMQIETENENKEDSFEYLIINNKCNIKGNSLVFYDKDIGFSYRSLLFNYLLDHNITLTPIQIQKNQNNKIQKLILNDINNTNEIITINNDISFNTNNLTLNYKDTSFSLSHVYYTSYTGNNSDVRPTRSNPDGAYIFAPSENEYQHIDIDKSKSFIQKSDAFTFIVLRYINTSYLIISINNSNSNEISIESIFDPISPQSKDGKNFVLNIKTNLNNINTEYNKPEIYTDSQGLNMLKRVKDIHTNYTYTVQEKVTSNFYPIASCVGMKDNKQQQMFTVYCDRGQGVGVINDGEIQILCHRFSTKDDWKGVAEGLYENSSMNRFFSVKHKVVFGNCDYDKYFTNGPLLFSVVNGNENIMDYKKVNIIDNNNVDVYYEVRKCNEILVQVGNTNCEYFNQKKEKEVFKFLPALTDKQYKVKEICLNGVDDDNNNENDSTAKTYEVNNMQFKLFKLNIE